MKEKIRTFVNFSIKKGDCVFGIDKMEVSKKRLAIILIDNQTGESSVKKALKIARKNSCKVFMTVGDQLDVYTNRQTKVIGITDIQLANAIEKNIIVSLREISEVI